MRAKIRWILGAAVLAAALFSLPSGWLSPPVLAQTFGSGPGPAGIQLLPQVEQEVGRLTNALRRQHGLPPLVFDPTLREASRQHSSDMLRRRFFSHRNPEGLTSLDCLPPSYASRISRSGENIWTGSGYAPADPRTLARMILDSWMSSPGHRRNILTPGFTQLGVGVAAWGREIRATQIFTAVAPVPSSGRWR